ncbi:galactokinase [Mycobacterium sp. CBMA293]|nr:galactokinase [Mycolicibacterium sp. CBMA 360]MUL61633.1 galactokinase [Mycolicibacterium sp. CBMA 335]MUL74369.1 galactokinase [Mycolicibacterium sp. CBMA 311]MUL96646.1 galactokinase [Mycolicibacterium sp. CBMA 230]MUM04193.1 galactokinase [Mycolicibacterium sp. CBMA 213]MUM15069.1 galactokinase [Mycolicibacterium sp. CBMA 293]
MVFSAPGRVNLIGEHTDYNLGFALPIALPQRTVVTFSPDAGTELTVSSAHHGNPVRIALNTNPGDVSGWAGYVAGVVWSLRQRGLAVPGGIMTITSDVPVGSGLSSSAALECAVLGAVLAAAGSSVPRIEQARIAQRAENEYVGAPTGLLDQLASLCGEPGKAVLIDFVNPTVRPVLFAPENSGIALLLIDSQTRHQHAGGEYADRRASCERAAAALGVASLRDITDAADLVAVADPVDAQRARHVVTENSRVLAFVDAVERGDYPSAGRLFTASQVSMRDDFQITTEQIDLIADTAVEAGALGARMTGGGFGGCVIALVPEDGVEAVGAAVRERAHIAGYAEPVVTRTHAAGGAGSN